jgi:tetratricopeptide (TPR) repeat protein
MKINIKQTLRNAILAHKAGKFQDAESLYRDILQSYPLHPEAKNNLGILESNKLVFLFQNGQYDAAISLAKSLTERFPKRQHAWKILGILFAQTGRYSKALKASQTATILSSQDFEAHFNLGVILKKLGKYNEAEASYRRTIILKEDHVNAHNNLGALLRELGRLDESESVLRKAIIAKADFVGAINNLGITLQEMGKLDEAEESLRQAIALKPEFADAYYNLGITLKKSKRIDEAEVFYRQAIELNPGYIKAYINLGIALKEMGRLDEAEATFRKAIALKPEYAEAFNNLGITLKGLGRLDEVEATFRRAIELQPNCAKNHLNLTLMKKFKSEDKQFLKMRELYLDKNIAEEERCQINFGLARAYEDLGSFEQSFKHYNEGNSLHKKLLGYEINQDIELFEKIKSSYEQIKQSSLENEKLEEKLMPIFIVGMPRSGTTLVEQIISSHPKVTGAGELSFISQFGQSTATGYSQASKEALLKCRQEYLSKLEKISNGNNVVTDKLPHNFLYLGLIVAAFPHAKIVHVKRDPAAVCWANYKQYFNSKGLGYSYGLDEVISYHQLYEDLMKFWMNSLSKRIHNLNYELLTVDQENVTRSLIDYLGLDWDEKCLTPQNNQRNIKTASDIQVRKKVYQGSSQQWKKYEQFLY